MELHKYFGPIFDFLNRNSAISFHHTCSAEVYAAMCSRARCLLNIISEAFDSVKDEFQMHFTKPPQEV